MHFASPFAFLLLLVLPVAVFVRRRRRPPALRFSEVTHAARAGRSWRQRLRHLPLVLRLFALILLIVALARPQEGTEKILEKSEGIAIEMVVDRSGSMGGEMELDGERLTRLEAVKRVFVEFVQGNRQGLGGRPNDLIGMVAFARYADTMCPLTLAHDALGGFLGTVRLAATRAEDGTAIGDAVALAAARLKTAEEDLARRSGEKTGDYRIKSKIVILLTDGENNAGRHSPAEAAALARAWGIKVYAVGVGGARDAAIPGLFGLRFLPPGQGVDRATLAALAETTGGIFRMAEDADSLRAIYEEIDRLEKSEVESVRLMDYKELYYLFALAALGLLAWETLLSCTLLRVAP